MKILVLTRNAWDDTNAIGNTLSNILSGIEGAQFANIYFRSSLPRNNCCTEYFRITEGAVIRNWFAPSKIGVQFVQEKPLPERNRSENKERSLIRFIHKHDLKIAYMISNAVWGSRRWINQRLDDYVEAFEPDLMITFAKSAPQYYYLVRHLREKYRIPLISWIADDEYSVLNKQRRFKEIERLRYILAESAVVRGCSEEICAYYGEIFGCEATPLYKGCGDMELQPAKAPGRGTEIVYAGNMLYGRDQVIHRIADALDELDGTYNVSFKVFCNTPLSEEELQYFAGKKRTEYLGCQPYEVVKESLAAADIVLHAESFEAEQIEKTRYSFSTKIIDYLQSGSIILAVGPTDIASIRYIKKIPGAHVISDLEELPREIAALLDDAGNFHSRVVRTREFAQQYHSRSALASDITNTVRQVIAKEG